jgi:hypothetical protein
MLNEEDVSSKIDALIRALDQALKKDVGDFRRRRPSRKAAVASDTELSRNAAAILGALELAVSNAGRGAADGLTYRVSPSRQRFQQPTGDECGLTWYELREVTRLNDERLGLALNELLPLRVRCRRFDDERIYFLPAAARSRIQRRRDALSAMAA